MYGDAISCAIFNPNAAYIKLLLEAGNFLDQSLGNTWDPSLKVCG